MKPTIQCINLVKKDVPFRPVAYKKDGRYRIGYEHLCYKTQAGDTITEAEATELLEKDLEAIAIALTPHFKKLPPISPDMVDEAMQRQFPGMKTMCDRKEMFDALCALAFHIDVPTLVKSSLWKALENGADESTIRAEFERWVYEDGIPRPEHVARRQHEADHFFGADR